MKPDEAEDWPVISEEQMRASRERMRDVMAHAKPLYAPGQPLRCLSCKRQAFGADDLVVHEATPAGMITVYGITGTRCECGQITYDAAGLWRIEQARAAHVTNADYETTVTTVGKMPALYLKADLARALGLEKGKRLRWRPLSADRAEVTVLPAHDAEPT